MLLLHPCSITAFIGGKEQEVSCCNPHQRPLTLFLFVKKTCIGRTGLFLNLEMFGPARFPVSLPAATLHLQAACRKPQCDIPFSDLILRSCDNSAVESLPATGSRGQSDVLGNGCSKERICRSKLVNRSKSINTYMLN